MKNVSFSLIFLLIFQLVLTGCNSSKKKVKVLRLAHGLSVHHPVHKSMERMAKLLKEKSDGKLQIKIYPSQQLGTEREALELLQVGSLDMTKVSAAVLENFAPEIRAFSLPYLFRDKQHIYDVFESKIGEKLLLEPQKYLIRGLTYYDAGYRSFYTKKTPIRKPADLKDLKIRVQESPMAIRMVKALGASPTPISWGELYTALQQGIVDGAENNPPSFQTSRHYEVCKYYSLDEHTSVPDVLVIGTKTWNKLSKQQQKWVQSAADSSARYERKLWNKAEKTAFKVVNKAGVKVIRPDKAPFKKMTKPIYNKVKKNDPELYKIVQKIQAVK